MNTSDKILVTVSEAAQMLGLAPATVYDLANAGEFTKRYVGRGTRNFRLQVDELQQYAMRLPTEPKRADA